MSMWLEDLLMVKDDDGGYVLTSSKLEDMCDELEAKVNEGREELRRREEEGEVTA